MGKKMKFLFGAIFGRKGMSEYYLVVEVVVEENVCIFRQPIQQEFNDYYRIESERYFWLTTTNI